MESINTTSTPANPTTLPSLNTKNQDLSLTAGTKNQITLTKPLHRFQPAPQEIKPSMLNGF